MARVVASSHVMPCYAWPACLFRLTEVEQVRRMHLTSVKQDLDPYCLSSSQYCKGSASTFILWQRHFLPHFLYSRNKSLKQRILLSRHNDHHRGSNSPTPRGNQPQRLGPQDAERNLRSPPQGRWLPEFSLRHSSRVAREAANPNR